MRQAYLVTCAENDTLPNWLNRVGPDELDGQTATQASCLLLDADNWEQAYAVLEKIRGHGLPAIYLKSIVLVQRGTELPEEFARSFDAVINDAGVTEHRVNELSSDFEPINRWIDMLGEEQYETDRNLALKILRYFASRAVTVDAITTLRNKSGFIYPELEPFLGVSDGGVLTTLEFLDQQHLITGEFQTKSRFCSHCQSAFLNFKEVCTHCGSADLSIDELVHHFKCGYTAELGDYRQGDELICPKCDRSLKHIGVDYDKPSILYRCNSCAQAFQEPTIMTSCFSCGRSTEPENQLFRTIKKYSTTSIGQHAARFGLESLFGSILESELQLTPFRSFLQFVQVEGARIERYKVSQSTLLLFYLKGLETVYTQLGSRAGDMFKELSIVIHSVLRSSDIISAKDEAVFAVMLTETSKEQAERAVERMSQGVDELVSENLGRELELITELHEITSPSLEPTALLESFLGKHID